MSADLKRASLFADKAKESLKPLSTEETKDAMAKYQSVLNSTWDDPVFQEWSPEAKLLFFNLITSSRHNPIGLYAVSPKILMAETGLTQEQFQSAFQELQRPHNGYPRVRYDPQTSTVWIVNTLKHQPKVTPRNRNLIRHMEAILRQYARSPLVTEFLKRYKASLRGALKTLASSFQGSSKGLARVLKGSSQDLRRVLADPAKTLNKSRSKDKSQSQDQNRSSGKGFSKGKGFEDVAADAEFIAQLKKAYPAVDIAQEAEKMRAWLKANPTRGRKKLWKRFVQGWISRAQKEQEEKRGGGTISGDPRADRAAKLDAITEQVQVP